MYRPWGHQLRKWKILVLNIIKVSRSPPRATTNNYGEYPPPPPPPPGPVYRTINIQGKKKKNEKNFRETKYRTKFRNYSEVLSTNQINLIRPMRRRLIKFIRLFCKFICLFCKFIRLFCEFIRLFCKFVRLFCEHSAILIL